MQDLWKYRLIVGGTRCMYLLGTAYASDCYVDYSSELDPATVVVVAVAAVAGKIQIVVPQACSSITRTPNDVVVVF